MSDRTNAEIATNRFISEVAKRIFNKDTGDLTAWSNQSTSGYFSNSPNIAIDNYTLKSMLYNIDWVYIVNNLVATKISNQKLTVVETEIVNGEKIQRPAMDHELQAVLDNPNNVQSQNMLTYNWVIDLTLGGNGLVWHAKSDDTLHNLPFERITPDLNSKNGEILRYAYQSLGDNLDFTEFPASQVMHAMKPDPSNICWGLSAFIPGKSSIMFSQYSQEFLNSFYLKGATPQLNLELDSDVNEAGALRLLKTFEKAYGGRDNQRAPIITPKGVKAKPLTVSLADQQLITYINSNRETLINLLAIPKHELSIQDGGGLGSQEMRLSLRNFWLTTLKPTMRLIEGVLNKYFRDRLGPNHEIVFDLSQIEALQDDEVKKAEWADRLIKSGVMTPNEVRAKVYKIEAHPDGNELVGTNTRGLQVEPAPVIEPSERPSDNEPIRSIMDSNRKAVAANLIKNREELESKPKMEMENLAKNLIVHFVKILIPIMENELPTQFKSYKADKNSILKKIDRALARGVKEIEDEFVGRYEAINEPVVKEGFNQILQASFNENDANEIRESSNQSTSGVSLKSRALEAFKNINKTLRSSVVGKISDAFGTNKTLEQVTNEIGRNLSNRGDAISERVARTEVGVGTMLGRDEAFAESKEYFGEDLKKVWITRDDLLVRDGSKGSGDHVSLHNRSANENGFWVTGKGNKIRYPLDPLAVPEERINCRCDMIFVND